MEVTAGRNNNYRKDAGKHQRSGAKKAARVSEPLVLQVCC